MIRFKVLSPRIAGVTWSIHTKEVDAGTVERLIEEYNWECPQAMSDVYEEAFDEAWLQVTGLDPNGADDTEILISADEFRGLLSVARGNVSRRLEAKKRELQQMIDKLK